MCVVQLTGSTELDATEHQHPGWPGSTLPPTDTSQAGPMITGRGRRLIWLLSAVVVAGVLIVAGLGYWARRERFPVELPPPAAGQRQVVLAYLRSLDAHDDVTALALSAPGMRATTKMWLASTASITHIQIGAVQYAAHEPFGEQYSVSVNFLYRSHWWKDDPSFGNGEQLWGYWLGKINGRWLITDDGTG